MYTFEESFFFAISFCLSLHIFTGSRAHNKKFSKYAKYKITRIIKQYKSEEEKREEEIAKLEQENKEAKEKLEKIIEAGRFTQTSTNSQDVSYIVVSEKLAELRDLVYESLKLKGEAILANLTPETAYLERYAKMWVYSYEMYKQDPIKNDKIFFNAPVAIFVVSPNNLNGGLASSNMELITNALGLGTFFSGFSIVAAKDNNAILDLLGVNSSDELSSCLVIGYPDVKYKRTVPRKDAVINWI